jgi:hypothetical protein
VRKSKPGSSGSIRLSNNGLPHLEQGGRRLSTNLNLRGSTRYAYSASPQSKLGPFSPKMSVAAVRRDGQVWEETPGTHQGDLQHACCGPEKARRALVPEGRKHDSPEISNSPAGLLESWRGYPPGISSSKGSLASGGNPDASSLTILMISRTISPRSVPAAPLSK